MMSRRSFVMHVLAAAALVPFAGIGDADARQKTRGTGKHAQKRAARNRTAGNRSGNASLRRRHARHAYQPVPRPRVVRAPRSRLEEGWPYGWMDPRWSTTSGDPFYDPGRWN